MIGLSIGIGFTKFIGGGGTPPVHTPQTYALVGNSLFNFGFDQSVASILAGLAHPTDTVVQQITFNQNLTTNWNNPAGRTTGIDVKAYLASSSADFLGLVDLPGINDSLVDPAVAVVDWWQQAGNAGLRGTFYQMWYPVPGFDSTPDWTLWKAFITFLRPYHNRVLYDVRASLGGPEVLLAPVADVLAAVYDNRVALGVDFKDFFYDALHINELGYYVAALTHWAVMHQQSPVGLPWSFSPAIPNLDAPLAAALQAIVWDVVDADAYAKPGTWPSTVIPAAFTSGQWTATAGVDKIDVAVTTPPSDGGSTITDYEYELNASGSWVSGGGTTFSITGLTRGTAYAVRVRAKNAVGTAAASDSKTRTPPWQCSLTSAFYDFGGGAGFRGVGFSPWALNFGSKNREPIPSLTLIGAYYFTVNGETFIAFQGDQRSILGGMSVYIDSTEYAGTWVYNASSDYGVPATILVSAAGDIPVGTRMMEIRAAS